MARSIEVEIERNYAAFLSMFDELMARAEGRYALFRDQMLKGVFDTAGDAEREGFRRFGDEPYSIQQIRAEPVDLGFYSYALPEGQSSSESS